MTKDDFFVAINAVYGVRVWAVVDYWNVQIESTPPREIVFSTEFINANVGVEGMSPAELKEMLLGIPESKWSKAPNGGLTLYVP